MPCGADRTGKGLGPPVNIQVQQAERSTEKLFWPSLAGLNGGRDGADITSCLKDLKELHIVQAQRP
jgi:hypothetical protein